MKGDQSLHIDVVCAISSTSLYYRARIEVIGTDTVQNKPGASSQRVQLRSIELDTENHCFALCEFPRDIRCLVSRALLVFLTWLPWSSAPILKNFEGVSDFRGGSTSQSPFEVTWKCFQYALSAQLSCVSRWSQKDQVELPWRGHTNQCRLLKCQKRTYLLTYFLFSRSNKNICVYN